MLRPMSCCEPHHLCERCYRRELVAKRGQAGAVAQTWAERVCRGEYRRRDAWPQHEPRTIAIARRLVANLARDSRLLDDLAVECNAGAARWWERRPATYRREPAR
jgi:hypothetical protein